MKSKQGWIVILTTIAFHLSFSNTNNEQRSSFKILKFHAQSFVSHDLKIQYRIYEQSAVSLNMTIIKPIPGKILMNFLVRKLADEPNDRWTNIFQAHNVDFCKALESLRNYSTEALRSESVIPATFIVTCPLIPGFYYLDHESNFINIIPLIDGKYYTVFELVEVYEEVKRLINFKITYMKQQMQQSEVDFQENTAMIDTNIKMKGVLEEQNPGEV